MKKLLSFFIALILIFGLNSFYKMQNLYNNIFSQLGLETREANEYIVENIIWGSTTFPRTNIMAKMVLNKRASAVQEIGKYIKTYSGSPEFANLYATARLEAKPEKPSDPLYQTKEDLDSYNKDLKYWESEYPASVNLLLQQKLKLFLVLTSNISYDAKLEKSGSKMIFSDPGLEAKDEFWKACYRSGKPTVDAARSFAREWLAELGR